MGAECSQKPFKVGQNSFERVIKEISKALMTSPPGNFYEFGPFTLDASERTLRRGAEHVRLTPKEFDTLLVLVRGGGRVMSKAELLKEIWPDTFVEEATLAQNVFTLRKALARGDEGEPQQQYIETVPRRGYRFAATVRERPTAAESGTAARPDEAAHGDEAGEPRAAAGGADAPELAAEVQAAAPSTTTIAADAPTVAAVAPRVEERRPDETPGHPVRAAILIAL